MSCDSGFASMQPHCIDITSCIDVTSNVVCHFVSSKLVLTRGWRDGKWKRQWSCHRSVRPFPFRTDQEQSAIERISTVRKEAADHEIFLGTIHKGRPQNFRDFGPPPPLVRILARSIRVNPRNLPYYVCFWTNPPSPPLCGRPLCMVPYARSLLHQIKSVGWHASWRGVLL